MKIHGRFKLQKRVLEPLFVFEFWIFVIRVSFGCVNMRNLVWLKLIGHEMVVILFSVFLQFQIANAVNEGKLVPEEIIFALLSKRLEEGYCRGETGFILDGIPRTRMQAVSLVYIDSGYLWTICILVITLFTLKLLISYVFFWMLQFISFSGDSWPNRWYRFSGEFQMHRRQLVEKKSTSWKLFSSSWSSKHEQLSWV